MSKRKRSRSDRLLKARVALTNTGTDAEIRVRMAGYGYTADKLAEGKKQYTDARQLCEKRAAACGNQISATKNRDTTRKNADTAYMNLVKIARVAFKNNPGARRKLDLKGRRKHAFSGWLGQARQFYLNALADDAILMQLGQLGITRERLVAGKQFADDTEILNAHQKKAMGESQQATRERNIALKNLDQWMGDFNKIARIALADKPQLLEKLGIVVKS